MGRILIQNVVVSQIIKKFPAFYGTWRRIAMFTGHCPQPDESSQYNQTIILAKSILILYSHLCLCLSQVFSFSGQFFFISSDIRVWYRPCDPNFWRRVRIMESVIMPFSIPLLLPYCLVRICSSALCCIWYIIYNRKYVWCIALFDVDFIVCTSMAICFEWGITDINRKSWQQLTSPFWYVWKWIN
jgi:hypothetical protein